MVPCICPGNKIQVQRRRFYWPGDVVIIYGSRRKQLLVHRMLGWRVVEGCIFVVTAGDANSYMDTPVPATDVLGRVVSCEGHSPLAYGVSLKQRACAAVRYLSFGIQSLRRRIEPLRQR